MKITNAKKAVYSKIEMKSYQRFFLLGHVVSFNNVKIPLINATRVSLSGFFM